MLESLSFVWDYLVPFVVLLTALVFVHEMGHYIVARINGVRIEVFSIGFGPELIGFTDRVGTRWKFSVIPLGGYVKMFGDRDGSSAPDADMLVEMTEAEKAVSFHHKRLGQRTAIVSAGPIANFLFAVVILTFFYMVFGQPSTVPEIAEVAAGSAAEKAGLKADNHIGSIDGRAIERFEDVQLIVHTGLGAPMDVTVMRDGAYLTMTAIPDVIEYEDRFGNAGKVGRLGVRSERTVLEKRGLFSALWHATLSTYDYSLVTLKAIGQFITGVRSTKEMAGPIGIAKLSGDMAEAGITAILWLAAILSINLGLINLFPIPVLDGGHLLFYVFEAVRGRPLGARAQEFGFRFGLGLVLLLMIFVTWNDLVNIVGGLV